MLFESYLRFLTLSRLVPRLLGVSRNSKLAYKEAISQEKIVIKVKLGDKHATSKQFFIWAKPIVCRLKKPVSMVTANTLQIFKKCLLVAKNGIRFFFVSQNQSISANPLEVMLSVNGKVNQNVLRKSRLNIDKLLLSLFEHIIGIT